MGSALLLWPNNRLCDNDAVAVAIKRRRGRAIEDVSFFQGVAHPLAKGIGILSCQQTVARLVICHCLFHFQNLFDEIIIVTGTPARNW